MRNIFSLTLLSVLLNTAVAQAFCPDEKTVPASDALGEDCRCVEILSRKYSGPLCTCDYLCINPDFDDQEFVAIGTYNESEDACVFERDFDRYTQ